MNRAEVERIVAEARRKGERPCLRRADLLGLDLNNIDLRRADLYPFGTTHQKEER